MREKAPTLIDRLQFGLISAGFGAVLGVFVALCVSLTLALLGFPYSFNRWMIVFSAAFFFFIGIVRGVEAADTVADALTVAIVSVLGSFSAAGGGSPAVDGNPEWKSGLWWVIIYLAGMISLAWLG